MVQSVKLKTLSFSSGSQGSETEPLVGLLTQQEVCFSLSAPPLHSCGLCLLNNK